MKAKDVLIKARRILVRRGWCRGQYWASDGKCCVMGAVFIAAGQLERTERRSSTRARARARALLKASIPADIVPFISPESWNDTRCRDKKQALKLFDAAIERA